MSSGQPKLFSADYKLKPGEHVQRIVLPAGMCDKGCGKVLSWSREGWTWIAPGRWRCPDCQG